MRKHQVGLLVEKNSFVDEGEGLVKFPKGQTIVDGSEMHNGRRYEIETLDISEFKEKLTADHIDSLQTLIGKVMGTTKNGMRVTIDAIQFAVQESAYARLAYNLLKGGYLTDFSVETSGPWPGEDGIYRNAKLVGLSAVVIGNNKSATINKLVLNSIEQAKEDGLDVTGIEKDFLTEIKVTNNHTNDKDKEDMTFLTIKNSRDFAVKVSYKNASGEDVETELAPGAGVDVAEEQKEAVEKQVTEAQAPKEDNQAVIDKAVAVARAEDEKRLNTLEGELKVFKEAFDKNAKEPEFQKSGEHQVRHGNSTSKIAELTWKERVALLAQNTLSSLKGDHRANQVATAINSFHLEQLQKEGKVSNSVDLGTLGNFVIPPEMITEIQGHVSNYRPILDLFKFQETLSLDTSWLERTGELEMEDVDIDDNGDNGDLKPIKNPSYETHIARLTEFAAVTPVKTSAIRFAAADLVQELTSLYRRAYDRALAQSVVGRLEKAVEGNGNSVPYNFSSAAGGNVEALVALITAWSNIAEHSPNGVFLMTENSRLHLTAMALRSGVNGPLASLFTQGPDGIPKFLSRPYAVVPGDLMPSLNTAATKSWTFEGVPVTVNHGVLFSDPQNFMGRVSGGLNFQMSTEASYEDGSTVKSAFQRDEVLFRGYGYRKSAVTNTEDVSGVLAPGIS